jgi:hypothetical protein
VNAWEQTVELESGKINAPAHVVGRDDASGGSCLVLSPENVRSYATSKLSSNKGAVSADFTVPRDGEYYAWLRFQWHCSCERGMRLLINRTPGTSSLEEYSETIHDATPAQVWHWRKFGPVKLSQGTHELAIFEGGHQASVDVVAVADDPEYTPPSYSPPNEAYTLQFPDPAWKRSSRVAEDILDSSWSDFALGCLLQLRPASGGEEPPHYGFYFAKDDTLGYYEVAARKVTSTEIGVTLFKVPAHGDRTLLAQETVKCDISTFYPLDLIRVSDLVEVRLNEKKLFDVRDASFLEGRVGWTAVNDPDYNFDELSVRRLSRFEENFQSESLEWSGNAAIWRKVSVGDTSDSVYLANSEAPSTSFPNWKVGGAYSLDSKLKLEGNGSAGIAFDVGDDGRGYVFSLNLNSNRDAVALTQLAKSTAVLWEKHIELNDGQWYELGVQRDLEQVTLQVDGEVLGRCRVDSASGGRGGLHIASGSAMFSSFRGAEGVSNLREDFVFTAGLGVRSLAHWDQRSGQFRLRGEHLGLDVSPEGGEFELAYRGPIGPDFHAALAVSGVETKAISAPEKGEAFALEVPSLSLPGTEQGGRFGFRIVSEGGPTWEFLTDCESRQTLSVYKNGALIKSSHVRAASGTDCRLELAIGVGTASFSLSDGPPLTISDTTLGDNAGGCQIAIIGKNIEEASGPVVLSVRLLDEGGGNWE